MPALLKKYGTFAGTFAVLRCKPALRDIHKKRENTMRNTEQTLNTAIGELRCLSPNSPASLDELTALSAARDCVDELLRSCVAQLRAGPQRTHSWADIAYALGAASGNATRQRYGSELALADEQVRSFWRAFADRFAWEFLPAGFLHALYTQWMGAEFPEDARLSRETFTRRLKVPATASGEWAHTRSRPGVMMNAAEPLAVGLAEWSRDGSNDAIYGLRRSGTTSGILTA